MDNSRIIYLVDRCLSGVMSPEEKEELSGWINGQPDAVLEQALERAWAMYEPGEDISSIAGPALDRIEAGLFRERVQAGVVTMNAARRRRWWMAAAIGILLAGIMVYVVTRWMSPKQHVPVAVYDAAPGSNKAVLTLGNGARVILDSAGQGTIAEETGSDVTKVKDGELAYTAKAGKAGNAYNTLTTPRGGQYQVRLPDGTRVWLNAASSITYPTAFTGTQREVSITGEAYFEVARDAKLPFMVRANAGTVIQVLGTDFNVNAYTDEAGVNTTLLTGSVRVRAGQAVQLLAPGQQAQVENGTASVRLIKDADVKGAVAWKDGAFSFANADLRTVMRQLARWYNVDVEYRGTIQDARFSGEIGRELSLSEVLKGLSRTRINYTIERGNKLVILP